MGNDMHLASDSNGYANYPPVKPKGSTDLCQLVNQNIKLLRKLAKKGPLRPPYSSYRPTLILDRQKGAGEGVTFDVDDVRYHLTFHGLITMLGHEEWPFEPTSSEGRKVEQAIKDLREYIYDVRRAASTKAERRRTVLRRWIIGLVALVLVGSGAATWVHYGWIVPEQARAAQRAEYDTTRHQLPGENTQLSAIIPATMPDYEFEQIPWSAGERDPLTNPRMVELMGGSKGDSRVCASLPQLADRKLRLAMAQSSPYRSAVFYLGLSSKSGTELCALAIGNENRAVVAVQIVP